MGLPVKKGDADGGLQDVRVSGGPNLELLPGDEQTLQ